MIVCECDFSFEYPAPDHSGEDEGTLWLEASYRVRFRVHPGSPISWDTPGEPPHPDEILAIWQIGEDGTPGPEVWPCISRLSEWPGFDALDLAMRAYVDQHVPAPLSHRWGW